MGIETDQELVFLLLAFVLVVVVGNSVFVGLVLVVVGSGRIGEGGSCLYLKCFIYSISHIIIF